MEATPLTQLLSKFWWLLLLRGVLAILFGVSAFAWPGLTLGTMIMLFAAFSLVDGVFEIVHAVGHRKELEHWGLMLVEGLFGVVFGVLAFQSPVLTTEIGGMIIAFYMAAWAIVTGAIRIAMAVKLRKEIEGEWLLALSGAVSIAFGILIMARPAAGVLAAVFLIGTWAIFLGVTLIALAFKTRRLGGKVQEFKAKLADR